MADTIPEGFEPLFRSSPFLDRTGPFYSKGHGKALRIGLCGSWNITSTRAARSTAACS